MQAVDAQKRSDQWRRENGRYIPNPEHMAQRRLLG